MSNIPVSVAVSPRRQMAVCPRWSFANMLRRGFCAAVFPSLLIVALVQLPSAASAQPMKLTEKRVQDFIASYKEMDTLLAKIPEVSDKIDPKLQAQLEAAAKKNGFASYSEYEDVSNNIFLILSSIDPHTKTFTEPPELITRQIAAVKANKEISKDEKKQELENLNEALKDARPVEFKDNITLVMRYFDKLRAFMPQSGG